MRGWALSIGTCLVFAGCFDQHGRGDDAGPGGDGGGVYTVCAAARDDFAEGARCDFEGSCARETACCTETWRCQAGVVGRERTCSDVCWRTCDAALEGARDGERCEGTFDCTMFDSSLCCAREVRCVMNRIETAESCADDCPTWCPGYVSDPTARPCRSSADCSGPVAAQCVAPGETGCGGPCRIPERTCASDPDCPDGARCVERPDPCSCDGSGGTACEPDCATVGCPPDQQCGTDGACRRAICDADSDCSCGACVNGACHDGPGECAPLAP